MRRSRHVRRWWLAWVPAAVPAAALVLMVARAPLPQDVVADLAEAARAGLDSMALHPNWTARQFAAWATAEAGFSVGVPAIEGATLVGARRTTVNGAPGITLAYVSGGLSITYVAFPSDRLFGVRVPPRRIRTATAEGYAMAVWAEPGGTRAVVGPLPPDRLAAIARACQAQATTD